MSRLRESEAALSSFFSEANVRGWLGSEFAQNLREQMLKFERKL